MGTFVVFEGNIFLRYRSRRGCPRRFRLVVIAQGQAGGQGADARGRLLEKSPAIEWITSHGNCPWFTFRARMMGEALDTCVRETINLRWPKNPLVEV
jgi:hypothetical protein